MGEREGEAFCLGATKARQRKHDGAAGETVLQQTRVSRARAAAVNCIPFPRATVSGTGRGAGAVLTRAGSGFDFSSSSPELWRRHAATGWHAREERHHGRMHAAQRSALITIVGHHLQTHNSTASDMAANHRAGPASSTHGPH